MFCPNCRAENAASANFCKSCGNALAVGPPASGPPPLPTDRGGTMRGVERSLRLSPSGRNPSGALVLSILIPGLGQFYNGDNKKGVVMLLLAIVPAVLALGIKWYVWLGVLIWSAVDAYRVADAKSAMW